MSILHFIYTEGFSGAERHVTELLPRLNRRGVAVRLLLVCPEKTLEHTRKIIEPVKEAGIPVDVIHADSSLSPVLFFSVFRFLRTNKVRIVHTHLLRSDLIICLLKRFLLRKLFIVSNKHGYNERVMCDYLREDFRPVRDRLWKIAAFTFRYIDVNIVVSAYMVRLFKDLGFGKITFTVIPHGIATPEVISDAATVYKKAGRQMLVVGRLEPLKGQSYVIDAFGYVLREFPDTALVLVGSGSDEARLKAEVAEKGLQAKVYFEGFRQDAFQYMCSSDLLVVSSFAESFGLVFLEGMHAAIPIVAFDVPAGNEIIVNEKTGILSPVGDSRSLASSVIRLFSTPAFAEQLGINGSEAVQSEFSPELMAERTARLYPSRFLSSEIAEGRWQEKYKKEAKAAGNEPAFRN